LRVVAHASEYVIDDWNDDALVISDIGNI
jgi:hypothetical protein